jgi:putative transposase
MGRERRRFPAGTIAHIYNRAIEKRTIFHDRGDYQAFLDLMEEARYKSLADVWSYCIMPNHWHMVLRSRVDRGIPTHLKWITGTHVHRYRTYYRSRGLGHLYPGRFCHREVETESQILAVMRYVEANAGKARLVIQAEDWPWSSGYERATGNRPILADLRFKLPRNWRALLNPDWPDPPPAGADDGFSTVRSFWKGV